MTVDRHRQPGVPIPRRSGATLLELVVVIGILGLLMALLIPGVQSARATARGVRCRNNLRQLGIASHNRMDQHGWFDIQRPLFSLLPFVDEAALHEQLDQNVPVLDSSPSVSTFACPDDPYLDLPRRHFSYLLNGGVSGTDGVARFHYRQMQWDDIADGLSTTALFGEQLMLLPEYFSSDPQDWASHVETNPRRFVWHLPRQHSADERRAFADDCMTANDWTGVLPILVSYDRRYGDAGIEPVYYHTTVPNTRPCVGQPVPAPQVSGSEAIPLSSMHVGGAHLVMCDGSVHFISDHIDLDTLWALGTRAGGDAVGEF